MAEPDESVFSDIITFDIYDNSELENNDITIQDFTQEEKEEIEHVVSLIDSVNSKELMDFSTQENTIRHKPVSTAELDRLAGKNNAITTNYQTKRLQLGSGLRGVPSGTPKPRPLV